MQVVPASASRPALRSPVTYNVSSGSWTADSAVRASDGTLAIDRTFASAILGQTVSISVLVPSDYLTSGLDYPVVWHMHGLQQYPGGTNNRYGSGWYQAVYGNAVRAGKIRPHITVFPSGMNYSMWIDDDQGALLIERYLILEVLPWVRANYRTLTEAQYNAVTGFSMGARSALYQAIKRPDVFGSAISYGAPLYDENAPFASRNDVDDWGPYILSPTETYTAAECARWLECSPQGWLTRNATKPRMWINYGVSDGLTEQLNIDFMALLDSHSIAYTTATPVSGAGHNAQQCWASNDAQNALEWLEAGFAGGA